MPSIKVSPWTGLLVEGACVLAAVSGTVACVQGSKEALPVCVGAWVLSVVNSPQVFRFFTDKPARKYYTKFQNAVEVLKNTKASPEKKEKAFEKIVEAARGGYTPAMALLSQMRDVQQENE